MKIMKFKLTFVETRELYFDVDADTLAEAKALLLEEGTAINEPGEIDHDDILYIGESDIKQSVKESDI